jgi:hypothetical protein
MPYDAFISYCSEDKKVADAVCGTLTFMEFPRAGNTLSCGVLGLTSGSSYSKHRKHGHVSGGST